MTRDQADVLPFSSVHDGPALTVAEGSGLGFAVPCVYDVGWPVVAGMVQAERWPSWQCNVLASIPAQISRTRVAGFARKRERFRQGRAAQGAPAILLRESR